jgi:signal transduction histidine kinase
LEAVLGIPHSPRIDPPRYSVVDIRQELTTRQARKRDFESEDRCLASLAKEMATNPRNMLQKLVEAAIEYCHADTAGISLLEVQDGKELFRWEALSGVFAHMRNNTMPRDASPCGVTIDEDTTQLMYLAERVFPALKADPPFVEALLIPFHVNEIPIGTVWVVSHTPDHGFDAEDERFITALGQFASAAWQLWKSFENLEKINQAKDEFLAIISHELRTPLTVILNSTKLLSASRLGPHETAAVIASMQRNANLQLRLLNDLLHVSRIGVVKMEIHIAPLDITAVVSAAIDMVLPHAEAKQTVIALKVGTIPNISGDAGRLQQDCRKSLGECRKVYSSKRRD